MDTPGAQNNFFMTIDRFMNPANPSQIFIYTDGTCFRDDQEGLKAGCGFVIGPPTNGSLGGFPFRLEDKGPTDIAHHPSTNRAELRAVVAALQFSDWITEGWLSLCIATDSSYVVAGITQWIRDWRRNGWITSLGEPVANRDLWQQLLHEIRLFENRHFQVSFQLIPRQKNLAADGLARQGADMPDVELFTPYHILFTPSLIVNA